MSVGERVTSDHQLARLLQIGVVLEEVVEARAYHHYQSMAADRESVDDEIETLLVEAREESAGHREQLESLIEELDAESIPFGEIESLVEQKYVGPTDFDGVLYDQLASEETAYKFYDDLIGAIEGSDATFSVERARLLDALETLREEEAEGVEEVTRTMRRL